MKLPAPIMSDEEVQNAIEESLDLERDWLDSQQKPKQQHTRKIEPRMLRTREAAEYIGVSEWQLRQMVASGEIAVIRRKYFVFSVDDLNAWITKNKERHVL